MTTDYFSQQEYRVRLEWGRDGARRAAERGDILVIVDVLRFSTAVAVAVHHGALIAPCGWEDDPDAFAADIGGEVALSRHGDSRASRFSLSPLSLVGVREGTRLVLPSPNGATCSRLATQVPYLFAGALVNAQTVAAAVSGILARTSLGATVVACGERWREPGEDGALRFALEDYLGAGAVLRRLSAEKSPEAEFCARAFQSALPDMNALLLRCGSGQELVGREDGGDVIFAARLDMIRTAPVLRSNWFVPWRDDFLPEHERIESRVPTL